jgi:hypothetical protein
MSAKTIAKSKLAWTGILIVIIAALIFLPSINNRIVPIHGTGRVQDKPKASSRSLNDQPPMASNAAPASASSGGEQAGHSIIFRVLDAENARGIAGAAVITRKLAEAVSEALTDQNGQCVVPVAEFSAVAVRARGYVSRAVLFRPNDEFPSEYIFRLQKGIAVSGYVRSEDGKPIQDAKLNLTAIPLPSSLPKPTDREVTNAMLEVQTDPSGHWNCDELPAEVRAIELRLTHPEHLPCEYTTDPAPVQFPSRSIQSVAMSELKSGKAVMLMKRGFLITGIVTDERGAGIDGAQVVRLDISVPTSGPPGALKRTAVAAMTGLNSVSSPSGRLFNAIVKTDQDGKFTFEPMPEAHTVVATHQKGFAVAKTEQFSSSITLDLQPWGRIEGVLRVGSKPGANQRVALSTLIPASRPPGIDVRLTAVSDAEGKFTFPAVLPGDYRISLEAMGAAGSQSTIGTVRSGETCKVTLGGMGRPVIGSVVVMGIDSQIDWSRVGHSMVLKLPDAQVPSRADLNAYVAWANTDEGRNWIRAQRQYGFRIGPDGSFRVEDVEAGTYTMNILVPPTAGHPMTPIRIEVVVPEIPRGRSDTPFDLGVLKLQISGKANSESQLCAGGVGES